MRKHLTTDLLAGVTLAAVAVPEVMATAQLVGVSPGLGLTGFIVGALVFAVLGVHRILSVGPDSTIAPLLAAGALLVDAPHSLALLSLIVAVLLILISVVRGGWITQFLSRAVTLGLLAGIGVRIIASQVETLTGSRDAWLMAGVFAVIAALAWWSHRIPGALIGLVLAALVATRLDVPMLDPVAAGFTVVNPVDMPWSDALRLVPTALVIALLITVQTGVTEAATTPGRQSLDRDIGAVGAASLVSALVGSFALNASPPRTSLVQASGGKTKLVGLTAAVLVALALFIGGDLVGLLPRAAVAAVLLHVAVSLIRVREMLQILSYSRTEFGVALLTMILVVTFGIAEGVTAAALVTLLDRTRRNARPLTYRKGLIPQTNHWVPVDIGMETTQVPGVLVWSVEAPIWYADADFVVSTLHCAVEEGGPYRAVVLDAAGITDIDYTGIHALDTMADTLAADGLTLIIARANRPTLAGLQRSGVIRKVPVYATVADAVRAAARIHGLDLELRAARGKKKDLAALEEAGLDRECVLRDWDAEERDEDEEV